MKLYLQKQAWSQIWPGSCSLATPGLESPEPCNMVRATEGQLHFLFQNTLRFPVVVGVELKFKSPFPVFLCWLHII